MTNAALSLGLDRTGQESLQAQLVRQLRQLILERRVRPGDKLPSSRVLADDLSVSRTTVTAAVEQLVSEGYAEARRGSGVYVTRDLPDYVLKIDSDRRRQDDPAPSAPMPARPFELGAPDAAQFPYSRWSRLYDRVWRTPDPALLAKPDPLGWPPLRAAIAAHLYEWRGIACDPSQIVVTSGVVEAIDLISTAMLSHGDTVFVEEPGFHVIRRALARNGLTCRPSRVDRHGFDISKAARGSPRTRVAVVTPSRQYPLGMSLPLSRRLELLEWAARVGGFVVEDDFDSEFRYQGRPLPALMSLDGGDRVIYVGSFSKVLSPSLRLGFIVVPQALRGAIVTALSDWGPRASVMLQPVLAQFINDEEFSRHIRRMRRLYLQRQTALIDAIESDLTDLLEVSASPGGMHLVATFRNPLVARMTDQEAADRASAIGITATPLSAAYIGAAQQHGFILGYAAFDEAQILAGIARLRQALT